MPLTYRTHRLDPTLVESRDQLSRYFTALDLVVYREFFGGDAEPSATLQETAKNFYRQQIANESVLNGAEGLATHFIWPKHGGETVPGQFMADLSDPNIMGYLTCLCLQSPDGGLTPVAGLTISLSEAEGFVDREIKGIFCRLELKGEARREFFFAFTLWALMQACWWQSPGDSSHETSRFASVPLPELMAGPLGFVEALDSFTDYLACQHFDRDSKRTVHTPARCSCRRMEANFDSSHILVPAQHLKALLLDMTQQEEWSRRNDAVMDARPSKAVVDCLKETRSRATSPKDSMDIMRRPEALKRAIMLPEGPTRKRARVRRRTVPESPQAPLKAERRPSRTPSPHGAPDTTLQQDDTGPSEATASLAAAITTASEAAVGKEQADLELAAECLRFLVNLLGRSGVQRMLDSIA